MWVRMSMVLRTRAGQRITRRVRRMILSPRTVPLRNCVHLEVGTAELLSVASSRMKPSVDSRVIGECLRAAVNGPFFPDWEFSTLFGLTRDEVRAVADWREHLAQGLGA